MASKNPIVLAQHTARGWLLFLPLPPSTNARMIIARGRKILSREARQYMTGVGYHLALWRKRAKFTPIDGHARGALDIWIILPRTSCDCHNYGKVLFDAMERAGLVTNDRFLKPNYRGVHYDSKAAAIIVEVLC